MNFFLFTLIIKSFDVFILKLCSIKILYFEKQNFLQNNIIHLLLFNVRKVPASQKATVKAYANSLYRHY